MSVELAPRDRGLQQTRRLQSRLGHFDRGAMAKRGPDPKHRKKSCKPTQHRPAGSSDRPDRECRNGRKEPGRGPEIIADKSRRWIGVTGHAGFTHVRGEDLACIEPEHRGMGEAHRRSADQEMRRSPHPGSDGGSEFLSAPPRTPRGGAAPAGVAPDHPTRRLRRQTRDFLSSQPGPHGYSPQRRPRPVGRRIVVVPAKSR